MIIVLALGVTLIILASQLAVDKAGRIAMLVCGIVLTIVATLGMIGYHSVWWPGGGSVELHG